MTRRVRPRLVDHLLAFPYFVYGGFILPLAVEGGRLLVRGRARFRAAHTIGLFVVAYLLFSWWIVRPDHDAVHALSTGEFIRWHLREVVPIAAIFLTAVPRSGRRIDRYVLALLRVGAAVGFIGAIDFLCFRALGTAPFHTIHVEARDHFFTAWLEAHNAAGGLYAALAAIGLWWFLRRRLRPWVLLGLLAGLGLTGSRSAYLGFTIVAVVFLFRRMSGTRARTVLLLAGLTAVIVLVRAPTSAVPENGISFVAAESRLDIWGQAWHGFTEEPILGVGWGNFSYFAQNLRFHDPSSHAHNSYLEVLCELGLIGFTLLGSWMVSIVGVLWRRRRFDLLGALGAVAVSSITEHNFGAPTITGPLFVLIGMVLAMEDPPPADTRAAERAVATVALPA